MPAQVDTRPFRKGENVAATPGAVVYRDEVCEVIQYTPSTPEVRARPVLMIPPQINRYYFMDLAPERSFVEYAVSRGLQYFTISWRNPTADAVRTGTSTPTSRRACARSTSSSEITGSDEMTVLGLCAGGITTSTMLSTMAARGDERVRRRLLRRHAAGLLGARPRSACSCRRGCWARLASSPSARACSMARTSPRSSPGCARTTWSSTTGSTTT